MKYTLTVQSDDISEIGRVAGILHDAVGAHVVTPAEQAIAESAIDVAKRAVEHDTPEPPAEDKPTRRASKKQTRKSKDAEKPAAEPKAPSKDEVRKHLSAVGAEHGVEKVREICQRFGASGLRDLKEEHYAAAIAKCEEVMNGDQD